MKIKAVQRGLWVGFLGWTVVMFGVMALDVGAAQVVASIRQPEWQAFILGVVQAADAVWIVLAAAVIYFYLIGVEGVKAARRATIIIVGGLMLLLGLAVKTSAPFGPFVYTEQLGAKVFGVPFSVPLLWLVILCTARYTVLHFWEHARRWQIAAATGMLVLATDVSLEWVAWRIRGWWLWYFPLANTPAWPPALNYVSWLVLATAFAWFAFPAARPVGRHWKPVVMLGLINLLFWLTIFLRLGK